MNWRRCGYQTRIRDRGALNLSDEREWRANDRASRWLDARLNP